MALVSSSHSQLLETIKNEHINYFVTDDDVAKAEKLLPLRELMKQYLLAVKHSSKFTLPLFAEIFQSNVETRADYNAADTRRAFEALEKYASNLFTHPWRKEYKTIKLYCGFYKHNVVRNLVGAEKILLLMGYQVHERTSLVLEEPLDPDSLIEVSRNCLMGSIECEIMEDIFANVKNRGQQCTYKEIFKLRKSFSPGIDTIIDFLCNWDHLDDAPKTAKRAPADVKAAATSKKNDRNIVLERTGQYGRNSESIRVGQLVDLDSEEKNSSALLPGELYDPAKYMDKQNGYSSSLHHASKTLPERETRIDQVDTTNGHHSNSSTMKRRTAMAEQLKSQTLDDHIMASVAAIQNQAKLPPDHPSTRAETWGYVDKTLEKTHRSGGPGNRDDVLKDYDRAKQNAIQQQQQPKTAMDDGGGNTKSFPVHQQQSPQVEGGVPMRYGESDLIQFDPANQRLPPQQQVGLGGPATPFSQFYNPDIMPAYAYQHRHMGMYNPYDYHAPIPPYAQHYPMAGPPPGIHGPPAAAMLANSMQALHVRNATGGIRNVPPPLADDGTRPAPGEAALPENRRSFYDNMPDEFAMAEMARWGAGGYPGPYYPGMYARNPDPSMIMMHPNYPPVVQYPNVYQPPPLAADQPPSLTQQQRPAAEERRNQPEQEKLVDVESPPPKQRGSTTVATATTAERNVKGGGSGNVGGRTTLPPSSHGTATSHEGTPPPRGRSESPAKSVSAKSASSAATGKGAATESPSDWECPSCTYHNAAAQKICEICGRSRTKGAESVPLTSGGRQCPKCTLVNEKDQTKCVACETDLEDSPTYI